MGVFDRLTQDQIVQIVAGLVAADHGEGAGLGSFDVRRDETGRLIGDFYHARLSSVFQPVVAADGRITGHTARVRCDARQGPGISPWGVFSMIASEPALVRLDRLCRALHLLNYFERAQADWLLWLRVETRLLMSVKQDHGRVFGQVIEHYCGVPTSRVVIELAADVAAHAGLPAAALANYRGRGYRTAVNLAEGLAPDVLRFADFVRIPATGDHGILARNVGHAHSAGGTAVVKQIDTEMLRGAALRAGTPLLQGYLLGRPAAQVPAAAEPAPQARDSRSGGRIGYGGAAAASRPG